MASSRVAGCCEHGRRRRHRLIDRGPETPPGGRRPPTLPTLLSPFNRRFIERLPLTSTSCIRPLIGILQDSPQDSPQDSLRDSCGGSILSPASPPPLPPTDEYVMRIMNMVMRMATDVLESIRWLEIKQQRRYQTPVKLIPSHPSQFTRAEQVAAGCLFPNAARILLNILQEFHMNLLPVKVRN